MNSLLTSPPSGGSTSRSWNIALFVSLLLALALALANVPRFLASTFGRADIFGVTCLAALPLACWLAQRSSTKTVSRSWGLLNVAIATASGWWLFQQPDPASGPESLPRLWIAIVATVSTSSMLAILWQTRSQPRNNKSQVLTGLVLLMQAILIPAAYADSVSRELQEQLGEALASQRIVHSLHLARTLLMIAPRAEVHELSLTELARELDSHVRALDASLARPQTSSTTPREAGQKVAILIQLERNQEALDLLQELLPWPETGPIALDYCGLCCQRLGRWKESRDWYEKSRQTWERIPANDQRTQALVSAYLGIAYAERQMDHPVNAQKAYASALKIRPSAEIHFLLARLHEQQEQTASARYHLDQALTIAPGEFQSEARELLHKMSLTHFGCLLFTRPDPPIAPSEQTHEMQQPRD